MCESVTDEMQGIQRKLHDEEFYDLKIIPECFWQQSITVSFNLLDFIQDDG